MNRDNHSTVTGAVHWHASADIQAWTARATDAIASALTDDLDADRNALLLLSGGNTPAPVYRTLGDADLDWRRVHVGLVDERWTSPEDAGSNARLVRETLLTGRAAAASFMPLIDAMDDPELAARRACERFEALGLPPSAIVFGMGDDGHTASLFPRTGGLEHALSTSDAYAVIDAIGCDAAGRWPTRITLTPRVFAQAKHRLLLIHGATKRRALETALTGDDPGEFPVRALVESGESPLQVFWHP